MRLVTWNINSLRLRAGLLPRLMADLAPDVICLQETKVPDELFPSDLPEALGLPYVAYRGMKSYNGVAILSRRPLRVLEATPDWCGKNDRRHVAVAIDAAGGPVEVHNFYVPAGGDVPDPDTNPKFAHKLKFIAEARDYFRMRSQFARLVLAGDLNIAPLENDVWSHRQLLDVVSHTPPETTALTAWLDTGFIDAVRQFVPADQKHFTWWSYRNRDWRASDRGRRLDHVWVSQDLTPALQRQVTLKQARDWPQTSDHVPVCVEFAL